MAIQRCKELCIKASLIIKRYAFRRDSRFIHLFESALRARCKGGITTLRAHASLPGADMTKDEPQKHNAQRARELGPKPDNNLSPKMSLTILQCGLGHSLDTAYAS